MLTDEAAREPLGLAMKNRNASVKHAYEATRKLYKAGVPIIVESDSSGQRNGTAHGMGMHMEVYQLKHIVGMATVDVLRGATALTAERFGFQDQARIDVRSTADLVLVNGDVKKGLDDPKVLCLPIEGVWRDGVLAAAYGDRFE